MSIASILPNPFNTVLPSADIRAVPGPGLMEFWEACRDIEEGLISIVEQVDAERAVRAILRASARNF